VKKPAALLFGATAAILAWLLAGRVRAGGEWATLAFRFGAGLVLFTILPASFLKPKDHGFALGEWKRGLLFLAIAIPAVTPILWLGAPSLRSEYPLLRLLLTRRHLFLPWELTYLVYYVAWESLFRGYLQFGLEERLGAAGAIGAQTMASTLLHIGKPVAELVAAFPAGILFGLMAWRTRSILYPLLLHWFIGAATDWFCLT
jgi:membrane protease YdiL (CAAX protease family)